MTIPFYADKRSSEPLRRIISTAADRSAVTPQLVAVILSLFLEGVADEVSHGRVVRFPGFGIWGPYVRRVRGPKGEGSSLAVTPRFSASKGFRLQVRTTCPPNAAGAKRLRRHTINNAPSSRSVSCGARVFTSQQAARDHITRQLQGYVDAD